MHDPKVRQNSSRTAPELLSIGARDPVRKFENFAQVPALPINVLEVDTVSKFR